MYEPSVHPDASTAIIKGALLSGGYAELPCQPLEMSLAILFSGGLLLTDLLLLSAHGPDASKQTRPLQLHGYQKQIVSSLWHSQCPSLPP